jgi:hypothetical protein
MRLPELPAPAAHVHSDGEFHWDRSPEPTRWPVDLYTAEQVRQAVLEAELREPEGFVLVPREPTDEMHAAAVRTLVRCHGNADFPPRVYRAVLAAKPLAPHWHRPQASPLPTPAKASEQ